MIILDIFIVDKARMVKPRTLTTLEISSRKKIAPYIDISSLISMLHCWPPAVSSAGYCVLFNFLTNLRKTDAQKLQISSTEQPNWSNENFPLQQIKL